MFHILFSYLEKNNVLVFWRNYTGFCPGDAPSMISSIKAFISLIVKKENPNILSTDLFGWLVCWFYREVKMK